MKHKLSELFERISRRFTVWRVNRALNIRLTDWQIAKIFDDAPFPEDVRAARCNGKTTAQILFVLLCPKLERSPRYGFPPLLFIDSPGRYVTVNGSDYEDARLAFFFGSDGIYKEDRLKFIRTAAKICRNLHRAHIKINPITYIYNGSRHHFYK